MSQKGKDTMSQKPRSILRKKSLYFGSVASVAVAAAYMFVPAAQAAEPSVQIEICGTATSETTAGTATVKGLNEEKEFVTVDGIEYAAGGCTPVSGKRWAIDIGDQSSEQLMVLFDTNTKPVGKAGVFNCSDAVRAASDGNTVKCVVPD